MTGKHIGLLIGVLFTTTLYQCSDSSDPKVVEVPIESISLTKSTTTLKVGSSEQLIVQFNPIDATNTNITWTTSDELTVTAFIDGRITANKVGSATITATSTNGKTTTCVVTVIPVPVESVSLNTNGLTLEIGDSEKLTETVKPDNAANKKVKWESSDKLVATVSETGVVTALKIGDAVIKATSEDGGFSATCSVQVRFKLKTIITDSNDKPLSQATVLAFDPMNKTYVYGQTNNDGLCVLVSPIKKNVTILVAHPEQKGLIIPGQINNDNLIIKMTDSSYGSVLAPEGTCNIVGLSGRLNPIKDNLDRLYLYADNISINNGTTQPVTFDLINSLKLEDALGKVKTIWIPFIDGKTSLINYQPK